ncbi:Spc98 family-domain-containing protein [Gilbertella persicaria]|uniref:Spc98 family-domain-containing protein n=1 Tax=Gilbertella persicaria TaxID=101096 RepID=UPI00221F1D22|nr:Spc98 family-domain-containing protein [Gilbertella persicaria]KAI8098255.1 Spc98 family-domain-containing protein [Gilbertella persicaria]
MLPFTSPTKHASRNKLRIPSEMQKKHLELLLSLYSDKTHPHSPWIYYPQQLTNVVHQVRKSTADWLFSQVLVGDYGLYRYLSSFRHMFLLNYGDLATHFIEACALWRRQSMSTEEHPGRTAMIFQRQEMNALLVKASLGTEAEDQLAGFSLLLEQEKTQEYPFADLLLIDIPLVMTFDLEWPIDLFISPSDLKRYSHLWSFLISLKATQMALNNLWKILRTGEQIESHDERRVWQLRSLMLFWIDTVWNHIQIHVIDAHYQTMIHTISPSMTNKRKSRQNTKLDFEEIQFAHETFLKNTTRGCLLLSHECVKTMYDILKTCLGFCDTMEKISQEGHWRRSKKRKTAPKTASEIVNQWTNATHEQSWLQDVYATQEKFHYLTQHFFALASNQQPEVKSSGRMDVLLMQLDYNQWFSKAIYPTF